MVKKERKLSEYTEEREHKRSLRGSRENAYDKEHGNVHEVENIVKHYPSISYATECPVPIIAFDKLDGSNIRAEWSNKKGWYKLGTRKRLVDETDQLFGRVPELLTSGMGDALSEALHEAGYDRAMCFFELHGMSSFAGMHDPKDPTLKLTLFDVAPFKQGILEPEKFIELFGHLDVPAILYRGEINEEFIEQIRSSTLQGMTFEGVVCKGKNNKKTKMPIMFKQKSRAWLDKLHEYCGDNAELFRTLR